MTEERVRELWENEKLEFLCCECYIQSVHDEIRELLLADGTLKSKFDLNSDPIVWRRIALILLNNGRKKDTKNAYKRALELDSNDMNTWMNLGHLYLEENKYNKALASYKKAIEIDNEVLYDLPDFRFLYKMKGNNKQLRDFLDKFSLLLTEFKIESGL
ncbi:MAG: tetratricopeptide repeat protein [Promethearchaeota archaeon]